MNIQALQDLGQFTGSEHFYRHAFGMRYSQGVRHLAENADCYWLLDIVASYQREIRRDRRLAEFQLWELKVENGAGVVTCRADSGEPAVVTQEIEHTDFPLPSITLYVEGPMILLPSEH